MASHEGATTLVGVVCGARFDPPFSDVECAARLSQLPPNVMRIDPQGLAPTSSSSDAVGALTALRESSTTAMQQFLARNLSRLHHNLGARENIDDESSRC